MYTMSNENNYTQAINAYGQAEKAKPLNGVQIAEKLYEAILKNLYKAKKLHEDGKLDEMVKVNANTFDIIAALQTRLNHEDEEAKETSQFLYRFYNIVFVKLAMVLEIEDPIKEFDDLINYVKPVHQRWHNLAYPPKEEDNTEE